MLLVKCPRCKKEMKCAPRVSITKAVKVCVYCGRSFKIHPNLAKSRIVKKL
ncbi:MAG: hypothetical protein H8D38_04755 [DPANN group archaeon]|nr:hypothetical protein [DPANN group archaeon]